MVLAVHGLFQDFIPFPPKGLLIGVPGPAETIPAFLLSVPGDGSFRPEEVRPPPVFSHGPSFISDNPYLRKIRIWSDPEPSQHFRNVYVLGPGALFLLPVGVFFCVPNPGGALDRTSVVPFCSVGLQGRLFFFLVCRLPCPTTKPMASARPRLLFSYTSSEPNAFSSFRFAPAPCCRRKICSSAAGFQNCSFSGSRRCLAGMPLPF